MTSEAVVDERGSIRDGVWLTVLGAVGLVASLVLTYDKVEALKAASKGKTFNATCDLNRFVSCSAVVGSRESEAFGFPNSFMGIVGFTIVLVLGVLLLCRGVWPRLFFAGLQLGSLLAIAFITWLQYQSIFNLGRLCPYCMVVWTVTIPIFVLSTRRCLQRFAPDARPTRFVENWTLLIVLLWYVAIASTIWLKFGSDLWA